MKSLCTTSESQENTQSNARVLKPESKISKNGQGEEFEDWEVKEEEKFWEGEMAFLISETAKMRKEEENDRSMFPFISALTKSP